MIYLDSKVARIEAITTEWAERFASGVGVFSADLVSAGLFGILAHIDWYMLTNDVQVKAHLIWDRGPMVTVGDERRPMSMLCHDISIRAQLDLADSYTLLLALWGYLPHCLPPASTRFKFELIEGVVTLEWVELDNQ